jgi:hypothetical protein
MCVSTRTATQHSHACAPAKLIHDFARTNMDLATQTTMKPPRQLNRESVCVQQRGTLTHTNTHTHPATSNFKRLPATSPAERRSGCASNMPGCVKRTCLTHLHSFWQLTETRQFLLAKVQAKATNAATMFCCCSSNMYHTSLFVAFPPKPFVTSLDNARQTAQIPTRLGLTAGKTKDA